MIAMTEWVGWVGWGLAAVFFLVAWGRRIATKLISWIPFG